MAPATGIMRLPSAVSGNNRRRWLSCVPALALLVLAGCAVTPVPQPPPPAQDRPELAAFSARLSGLSVVPPNRTTGFGQLVAVLNRKTGELRWKLNFSGLTGPVRSADFHSPGMEDEVAPRVMPLGQDLQSPAEGAARLTRRQQSDLLAGQWYLSLDTALHPEGELRGQLIERD